MARARRVKKEREAVAWSLKAKRPPPLPCVVNLTRVAPSNSLDDDNLIGALKACRDQVAQWLGLDDRDPRVSWVYAQRRGLPKSVTGVSEWAVEIKAWGQA